MVGENLVINISLWALLINGLWEYAQCGLFYDMRGTGFWPGIAFMAAVIVGDMLLILALYGVGVLLWGRSFPRRSFAQAPSVWAGLLLVSVPVAVMLEYLAVALGLWKYNMHMPVVRIAGEEIGLAPILQIALVPAVSLWLAAHRPLLRR